MRKALAAGILALLAAASFGAAVFFGARIYDTCRQDMESEAAYEEMAQHVKPGSRMGTEDMPGPDDMPMEGAEGIPEEKERILDIDFAALKEEVPDLAGWLYCPDTEISYPVVQGQDNSYYLDHLPDGSGNRNGSLFMDCGNREGFADENTLVYGHHMASGKMFACLVSYADQAYYEAHPVIYFITEETDYRLELFSGYTAAVASEAYTLRFSTEGEFAGWLERAQRRSDFVPKVQAGAGDHVVTLSTCAYSFQDARYVVHGRLTEN